MARAGEATESEYSVRAVGRTGEGTNRGHRQASKRLFTLTPPSPAVRRMPVLAPYSLFNVISMPDIELREVEFDIEGPIVAVTESEAVRPPSQSDTRELTCWITTLEVSVMAAEWSRIVFLGPSLPLDQAKAILPDAEFRPPIKRDDLTAIPAGSIVGIIDGLLAKPESVDQ